MHWRTVLASIVLVLGALAATNPGEAALRQALEAELNQTPPPKVTSTNYVIFSVYQIETATPPARRCVLGAGSQFIPLRSC
jgi:hypothetical protein